MRKKMTLLHNKLKHIFKHFWLWFLPALASGLLFMSVGWPIVYIWTQVLIGKNYSLGLALFTIISSPCFFYLGISLKQLTNPIQKQEENWRLEQKKIQDDARARDEAEGSAGYPIIR
jgi:hypothetical protein